MECWAIIPVKPLGAGKSRLAAVLGAEQRAALNKHLFGRVLHATLGAFKPGRIAIVTADTLLLALMRGQGLHALPDPGGGLNAALGLACRYAADRGAQAVAVLPSDLPRVTTDDVKALVASLGAGPSGVIAPDQQEQGNERTGVGAARAGFFPLRAGQLPGPSRSGERVRHEDAHPAPAGPRAGSGHAGGISALRQGATGAIGSARVRVSRDHDQAA